MRRALVLLAFMLALAGCTETPEASQETATLAFDFAGQREPIENAVAYDPSTRPSAPRYEDRDVAHPDAYTVHDLLEAWSADSGVPLRFGYHQGLGFTLEEVDGVAAQEDNGTHLFWSLQVDGEPASQGISTTEVQDGALYAFTYTGFDAG